MVLSMGQIIRWILLSLLGLVLTALFEPPVMAFFDNLGWHDAPVRMPGDVMNWIVGIVGEEALPWVAGGIIGAAMGVWLHWAAVRYDRKTDRPLSQKEKKKRVDTWLGELVDHIGVIKAYYWTPEQNDAYAAISRAQSALLVAVNAFDSLQEIQNMMRWLRKPNEHKDEVLSFVSDGSSQRQALLSLCSEAEASIQKVRDQVQTTAVSQLPRSLLDTAIGKQH